MMSLRIRGPEDQGAHFDTFARGGIGRAVRIFERGMRGEARAAVGLGVVALPKNRLVTLHPRKVVPAMLRVVHEAINFADPFAIDEIHRHDILNAEAARVAERKRRAFDRAANRAPYV